MIITLVILGERQAAGRLTEADKNWPIIIYRRFLKRYQDRFTFLNLSLPENNSQDAVGRWTIEAPIIAKHFKEDEVGYVVFNLGQNDALSTKNNPPSTALADFSKNIQTLIDISKNNNWAPVFIGATPINEEQFKKEFFQLSLSNQLLEQYNQAQAAVCAKNDVIFLDAYKLFATNQLSDLLLSDGWHLSYEGQRKIFKLVAPVFCLD